MDPYYDITTHVSNSDLGRLQDLINGISPFDNNPNMAQIFAFGSLVDCMLLEPENVLYSQRSMMDPSGGLTAFEEPVWRRAVDMRNAGRQDKILAQYIQLCGTQQVLKIDAFKAVYQGYEFTLPARCKYDMANLDVRMGADLKTTAATSQKAFVESLNLFNYDRQGAWYMDLGNLDNFMFIGICKVPNRKGKHEVFHYAINRGDDMYENGKRKYEKLAWLYKLLIL